MVSPASWPKNTYKIYIKTSKFPHFFTRNETHKHSISSRPLGHRDCPQRHPGRADAGGTNAIIEGPPQVDRENRPKRKDKKKNKRKKRQISNTCPRFFFTLFLEVNKGVWSRSNAFPLKSARHTTHSSETHTRETGEIFRLLSNCGEFFVCLKRSG